jgi:hypothetical protein
MSYLGYFKDVFRYVARTKSLSDGAFQAGDEIRGHMWRLSVLFHLDEEQHAFVAVIRAFLPHAERLPDLW